MSTAAAAKQGEWHRWIIPWWEGWGRNPLVSPLTFLRQHFVSPVFIFAASPTPVQKSSINDWEGY